MLSSDSAYGAGKSKLSREPIPLQTEAYALLSVGDVLDYAGLVGKLRAGADAPDTPGGRVWELLSPRLRNTLASLSDDADIEEQVRYDLINGLNAVLRRNDLYVAAIWAGVDVPEEVVSDLTMGLSNLEPLEVTARNRELLQLSFPEEIGDSTIPPFPGRPRTLKIFGDDFLKSGNLQRGFTIPTGAVWQPSLFAYGTLRSQYQYVETGQPRPGSPGNSRELVLSEWANRLDLFFNLALTPTERILVGLRPIDQSEDYAGYTNQGPPRFEDDGLDLEGDLRLDTLFFEGDFGELFPALDKKDRRRSDFGFSVGRQQFFLQEGIMINDRLDAVGVTRNNILIRGGSNLQITGIWAWGNVNRGLLGENRREEGSNLIGLFSTLDLPKSTVDLDLTYIFDDQYARRLGDDSLQYRGGDQMNIGFSIIRRIGHFNAAVRYNQSIRTGSRDTLDSTDGSILFFEGSWTPPYTQDLLYGTFFWANNDFKSASRERTVGGPLGHAGILFVRTGVGNAPPPIANLANESVGGVIGYQKFFDATRKQVIFEVGGRTDTDGSNVSRLGGIFRYQMAIGQRYVWLMDAFWIERSGFFSRRRGVRTEMVIHF